MENSKNRQNDHLGVNKLGRNIRKSPLHQTNFSGSNSSVNNSGVNLPNRQQPQPQIYNISKSDFRSIVQQLTGSPSHDSLPKPPHNAPKPQSMRLQKIRPPPLTPMTRPHVPPPIQQAPSAPLPPSNSFAAPPLLPTMAPVEGSWNAAAESPISAYMRVLQSSITDIGPGGNQAQRPLHPIPPPMQPPPVAGQQPLPAMLNSPSFQMNRPPFLPSPTSQFLLPSPSGFMNLLSPRSPYPLHSPGVQFSPPLTPNFTFSPFGQSGLLGPGSQPPPSPGLLFPLSPTGFFPFSSPRWREP